MLVFPLFCRGLEENLLETVLSEMKGLRDKTKELEATIVSNTKEFEAKLVEKTKELEDQITAITREKKTMTEKLTANDKEISKLRQHLNKR